nr:MAG TPA: hypothetical protein [Herelleviridae sp.]
MASTNSFSSAVIMLHLPFVFVRQEAEVAAYGLEIAVGAGHVGFRGIRFDPAQAVLQPSHEGRDVSHIVYPTRDAAFHHEAGFHLSIADTEHWYPRHVRHACLNDAFLPGSQTDDKVGGHAGIGAEGKKLPVEGPVPLAQRHGTRKRRAGRRQLPFRPVQKLNGGRGFPNDIPQTPDGVHLPGRGSYVHGWNHDLSTPCSTALSKATIAASAS